MHDQNRFDCFKIFLYNDDDDIEKLILKNGSLIFSAMVFFPEKCPKIRGT